MLICPMILLNGAIKKGAVAGMIKIWKKLPMKAMDQRVAVLVSCLTDNRNRTFLKFVMPLANVWQFGEQMVQLPTSLIN